MKKQKKIKIFALILLIFALTFSGCSSKTITRSNLAFDTVVTMTIYNSENEEILNRAFDTIRDYDKKLNAFSENSIISSINREETQVDESIFSLLEDNLRVARSTDGDFNPLLGRLISLWDINEPIIKEAPDPVEIRELLAHTSIDNLILDSKNLTVKIADPEAELNLGASVKGFVSDILKEQLLQEGVDSALINLGGNILLIGDKNGEPFNIGIDDPSPDSEEALGSLSLTDKSIVTSGNYQRFFTDSNGNSYHHILDPKTGYPADNGLKEVVVVSDSSLEADLLSTAFFVLGKDRAIDYIKENYTEEDRPLVIFVTEGTVYIDQELNSVFTLNPIYDEQYQIQEFTPY